MSEETLKDIFARNLRYYLEKEERNQSDLCKYMSVSSATASDWCNGRKMPRADKIQSIANWLKVNIGDLMEDRLQKDIATCDDDPDIRRIERARKNMDQKNRDKMMKILEASFEDYFGDDFVDEDND